MYFKWMNCMVYKLYLKAVKKRKPSYLDKRTELL